jgi:iron-sulfur cluster repair protein YtfE (RIC family)
MSAEQPKEPKVEDTSDYTSSMASKRRKDMFGDCALVEIIHLHDCLRGALKALERDVTELSRTVLNGERNQQLIDLERSVAGRFKVIWSVFRAHSSAEDEFIWPTLQSKTQGRIKGSPKYRPDQNQSSTSSTSSLPRTPPRGGVARPESGDEEVIEQEEYEEDHADEERMFSKMDDLLTKFREGLLHQRQQVVSAVAPSSVAAVAAEQSVDDTMKAIHELTKKLSKNLMAHLEKEEMQCMPLVVKHLSKSEIHDLVGKIMGKRSSDMIAQIMSMAVQNLNEADREEMVKYMKQAMAGTFFDRWLCMSGWMSDKAPPKEDESAKKRSATSASSSSFEENNATSKRTKVGATPASNAAVVASSTMAMLPKTTNPAGEITSQAELEKLIRAVATNSNLTPLQQNTTIQGLRDSVWKSNQRLKGRSEAELASLRIASPFTSR